MQIGFIILTFIVGACLGSFLCCQARRLHLKNTSKKSLGSRSVCPHCKYQLKWYDNIPIFSWLALKGKCRKCHRKIGLAEILSEICLALAFSLISTTISIASASFYDWLILVAVFIFTTALSFLAIYDGLYGELPAKIIAILLFLAVVILSIEEYFMLSTGPFTLGTILDPFLSFFILGGLYLFLYAISKGKWVGDGDWYLGTAIALVLCKPWLALIALFLANFTACIVMYPSTKHHKHQKIHFGPFLAVAFVITYCFANLFLNMV